MLNSLRRRGAETAPASPVPFHAPLFHDVITSLGTETRHVVLDLGVASTAMLALLGQSRCRVEIADIAHFGGVERLNSAEPGSDLDSVGDSLLPNRHPGDAINRVFCWDLPNYLTLDALAALMTAIRERSRPGALAHALVAYSDPAMNESPGCFVPGQNGELMDLHVTGNTVAAPRYSPEDLVKNMGGFVIDRARLLSNGMQEFLFRLD